MKIIFKFIYLSHFCYIYIKIIIIACVKYMVENSLSKASFVLSRLLIKDFTVQNQITFESVVVVKTKKL